jgi:Tfp pilus assembly protein PilN
VKRINLLPPELRAKESRERGIIWAILIVAGVVAVLALMYLYESNQVRAKQDELAQATAQTLAIQKQVAALQPYAQIQATRTSMTTTAKGIYDARVLWSTILQEISLVIPDNVRLQSLSGAVPASMLPGSAVTAPSAATAGSADLTFVGTTYTHDDVADFMTRLGLMPQLQNIQLASSTGGAVSSGSSTPSTVSFTITASLRPFQTPPPSTNLQGTTP